MPNVRPFEFTGLPSWTKEQVAVQESMARYLSYRPFSRRFGKTLGDDLETYLKASCKFSKPEMSVVPVGELDKLLPNITCLLVIGAAPGESKILVDLDSGIASFCIDRLLGGSGKVSSIQRPLTEIEQGVLSFLLLKVLQHFDNGWHNGRELTLTLDRFAAGVDEVRETAEREAFFYVAGVKIGLDKKVGYARILVPQSLVDTAFATPATQQPSTPEELDYMRRVLRGLAPVELTGRVEMATLDLSPGDIANIEVGDIVILENHQVTLTPSGLEGSCFVRIGRGVNGGLRARVLHEGELTKIEVLEVINQEQPAEGSTAMADGEASGGGIDPDFEGVPDDDNLSQTEGLLRDVAAPVVVELGRIKLNTQQVVKLRPGQILRLPRGSKDPVNLVVNGKLFARGELIEVDGELGVRLTQVIGN